MWHRISTAFRRLGGWLVVTLAMLVVAGGGHARAQAGACPSICYVAPTGDDTSNSGDESSPFLTIQKALDTVNAGGTVHVAAGNYNPNFNVVSKSVTLLGAQAGAAVEGRDPDNAAAESIIAANQGFDVAGGTPIVIDGFTFKEKTVDKSVGIGVRSGAGSMLTIRNNIFSFSDNSTGIRLSSSSAPSSLTISSNLFLGGLLGVSVYGTVGATLSVTGNTFIGQSAIGMSPRNWANATISGNTFEAMTDQGAIYVSECTSCTVTGNQISDGTSFYGIQVSDSSVGTEISGNTLINPGQVGLQISFADGTLVRNNTITGATLAGVRIFNFATSTTVRGNTISGAVAAGIFADWLFEIAGGGVAIESNTISGVQYGVALEYPATVQSNSITGASGVGIDVRTRADTADTHVNQNAIAGNAAGLANGGTNTVDAVCNWWGAANGPSGTGPGTGDSVAGAVTFQPWLSTSTLSGPCDDEPPEITITTPAAGAAYALGAQVLAGYACRDSGSGIALCDGTVANGAPIDTSTLGPHDFAVIARDAAGNEATASAAYTVANGPQVAVASPTEGAVYLQGATVLAGYSCTPGDAPLVACEGAVPDGSAIDTASAGAHTFTVEAEDEAGLTASATIHYTVRVPGAPEITVFSPVDGAIYTQGAIVLAGYSCTPGDAPLVACEGAVPDGSAIDTASAGARTFTVEAEDEAGLTASATIRYTVVTAAPPPLNPPPTPPTAPPTTVPPTCSLVSYALAFRWTLITWVGSEGAGVPDALGSRGRNCLGNSVLAQVAVVWSYEPGTNGALRWHAYFPGKDAIPGANDLALLHNGTAYWIAILPPGPLTWQVERAGN